jgi:hypothetical protein
MTHARRPPGDRLFVLREGVATSRLGSCGVFTPTTCGERGLPVVAGSSCRQGRGHDRPAAALERCPCAGRPERRWQARRVGDERQRYESVAWRVPLVPSRHGAIRRKPRGLVDGTGDTGHSGTRCGNAKRAFILRYALPNQGGEVLDLVDRGAPNGWVSRCFLSQMEWS